MTRMSFCGPPIQANRGWLGLIALLTGASLPAIASLPALAGQSSDDAATFGELRRWRRAGAL